MATIRTAIQIQDSMTPAMRSMTNALNICISSFEAMQNASGNAVDTASLAAARAELARVEVVMDEVEQNIRAADNAQRQLNNNMRSGQSAAEGLASKIKEVAVGIATAAGIRKTINLSDNVTQTVARLDLMNDGMQSTAELQEMIFASAERSRGSYLGSAAAVAQLGSQAKSAFSNNAELIAFSEQLNKNFIIANTNQEGIAAATLQLTQGMASGVLRGEELNSVFENAQPIIQHIADYLQVDIGQIRAMAQEGQITASVVKNALLSVADETNRKFATMPVTFGQIWTSIENHSVRAFEPVLKKINEIANSDKFKSFVNGIISGMYKLSNEIQYISNQSERFFKFIANSWSFIEPIIWGVVAAYAAYNVQTLISAVRTGYAIVLKAAHAAASAAETLAIIGLIAAQEGLNAALYACPLSWTLMAIVAIIVIIYLAVAAVNRFAGTSYSATGIIMGAFYALGTFIANIIKFMVNHWISFVEFFVNVWNHPLYSVQRLFVNWGNNILNIIGTIASAIDKVFKTGTSKTVTSLREKLSGWIGKEPEGYKVLAKLNMTNLDDAFNKGYQISDNFSGFNLNNNNPDYLKNILNAGPMQGMAQDMADTAANTGKMKDSLDVSTEDLKYLRDIAEQEVINRFTTAEINVSMNNQNTLSSAMDLDGVVTHLKDSLIETVQVAAEKVHK